MKAKIFSGGRITIPAALRQRLGLKPGTKLLFDDSVGYLKATKYRAGKPARPIQGATAEDEMSKPVILSRAKDR